MPASVKWIKLYQYTCCVPQYFPYTAAPVKSPAWMLRTGFKSDLARYRVNHAYSMHRSYSHSSLFPHSTRSKGSAGFTVVELVVVLVLVSILAFAAFSRLLNVSTEARINSVTYTASQLDIAVKQIAIEAMFPGKEIPRSPPSSDGSVLDVNGNGVFDAATDILLINSNVDNTDVDKIIDIGGSMVLQEGPSNNQVHIGYDMLGNGNIRGGNCRVYFRQANASERFAFVSHRTDGC